MWKLFQRKPRAPQKVTTGRFEIERDGEVAYLNYTLAANILTLEHTEVPEKVQHMGLASKLAETAFRFARDHNFKVDVVCPTMQQYVAKHPEYSHLILR